MRIPVCSALILSCAASACVAPPQRAANAEIDKSGIAWVNIPGGDYEMGNGYCRDARPQHKVTVKTFQMAKTEVTVGQYKRCVAAGACKKPVSAWARDTYPMAGVAWDEAQAFAVWAGGRLPTEAEWEYAARSAGKEIKIPWGDRKPDCKLAVFAFESGGKGCGKESAWPVCSKPKGNTEQGLCDMAGNVSEWVQDRYHDTYDGAPTDGRAWESPADEDPRRVARGSDWSSPFVLCTRGTGGPETGLRLVR